MPNFVIDVIIYMQQQATSADSIFRRLIRSGRIVVDLSVRSKAVVLLLLLLLLIHCSLLIHCVGSLFVPYFAMLHVYIVSL